MTCLPHLRDSPYPLLEVCRECEYREGGTAQACAGMVVSDLLLMLYPLPNPIH